MKKIACKILTVIFIFSFVFFPIGGCLPDATLSDASFGLRTVSAAANEDDVSTPKSPFDEGLPGFDGGTLPGFSEETERGVANGNDTLILGLIFVGMILVAVLISVGVSKGKNGHHRRRRYAFDVHYNAKQNLEKSLKQQEERSEGSEPEFDPEPDPESDR